MNIQIDQTMDFQWNIPAQIFGKKEQPVILPQVKELRNMSIKAKKQVIEDYFKFYNKMLDKTIKAHNEKIYGDLTRFLNNSTHRLNLIATKIATQRASRLGGTLTSSIQKE